MSDSALAYVALTEGKYSSNGYVRATCPYCPMNYGTEDKKFSFAVKVSTGWYYCLRCGVKGRIDNIPEDIASRVPDVVSSTDIPVIERPDDFYNLSHGDGATAYATEDARRYLKKRGIGPGVWNGAGIGACVGGYFTNRIIVPVFHPERRGCWAGYIARDWTDTAQLRYRYPKGMRRGSLLFNQEALEVDTDEPLLCVEGVFDALPYWPSALAFLGKPGHGHRNMLLSARRPLVVVLDGDAHREGWALSQWLQLNDVTSGSVRLPPKTDPNDVDTSWLLDEARNSL